MPGSRACVAARPLGAPTELGLALVDSQGLWVHTVDGGQWRVPLDAGVRDLQMTSVAGRWLVVWDSEQGLMAGLFSDSEPQVVLTVDERPSTHRGAPSVASSPLGAAVVTWPVLQGDSVGLRVGVIRVSDGGVPSADGGAVVVLDGGSSDGGLLPGDGGLMVDAGQPDGGSAVADFVPVCGCSGGGATLVWLLVLAPVVRRGRRRG